MCRMLGVFSQKKQTLENWLPYLEMQAKYGMNHPHGDGFGITYFENSTLHIRHEMNPIWDRTHILQGNEQGDILVMHARQASKGSKNINNVQPFYAKSEDTHFVFCHNGTVFDIEYLDANGSSLAGGESDSKVIFEKLIESLPFYDDLPTCVSNLILEIVENCQHITSLNCLFSNGGSLGAVRYCFSQEDYYTLWVSEQPGLYIVSTEKFSDYCWKLLPNHSLWIVSDSGIKAMDL